MQELLRSDGGCALPCVWTLCPGVTDRASLRTFTDEVASLAHQDDVLVHSSNLGAADGGITFINIIDGTTRLSVVIDYFTSGNLLDHVAASITAILEEREAGEIVRSHVVYGNYLFRDRFWSYLLPQVLSSYGKPSQVLLLPVLYDPPLLTDSIMSLVLVYEDQGFLVEYFFPNGAEGDHFIGCPSQTGAIDIFTWSPDTERSLGDIAKLHSSDGLNELTVDYYKPIEEATSLTSDEFSEQFVLSENTNCLRTPKSLWPY